MSNGKLNINSYNHYPETWDEMYDDNVDIRSHYLKFAEVIKSLSQDDLTKKVDFLLFKNSFSLTGISAFSIILSFRYFQVPSSYRITSSPVSVTALIWAVKNCTEISINPVIRIFTRFHNSYKSICI